jgi:tetratricopeptide (TPR) repeat protein
VIRTLLVAIGAIAACASSVSIPFQATLAAADRAHAAGRTREAAEGYDHAASIATRDRDRAEALYRAASDWQRAGNHTAALERLERVAAHSPDFARGARAALDAALLRLAHTDAAVRAQGEAALDTLVRTRATTGPARRALFHALRLHDARDPTHVAAVAWLDTLSTIPAVRASRLYVSVRAERAVRLAASGRRSQAIAAWRALLDEVPYPQNNRWDDGHVALATLLRSAGDTRAAIEVLTRMLSVRDPGCTGGSCDAPRFQEGAMLRAEMLRDDLRDFAAAAAAYHDVYVQFATSRVRDDALWQEALTHERAQNMARACEVWAHLAREFATNRRGRDARDRVARCRE